MNLVLTPRLALGVIAAAFTAACGSSTATNGGTGLPNYDATAGSGDDGSSGNASSGGSSSGGYGNSSSGNGGSSSGGGGGGTACVSHCSADSDCANSCPAAAAGSVNCCDTGSGTCFVAAMAACPGPGQTGAAE